MNTGPERHEDRPDFYELYFGQPKDEIEKRSIYETDDIDRVINAARQSGAEILNPSGDKVGMDDRYYQSWVVIIKPRAEDNIIVFVQHLDDHPRVNRRV